ncbi:hypothetical protein, partial [Acetobacter pasteurianus]
PEITGQAHQSGVLRSLHIQSRELLFNTKEIILLHLPFIPINPGEMESQGVYQNPWVFEPSSFLNADFFCGYR